MAITEAHRRMLQDSAITADVIDASGIESTPKGLRFPWNDGTGVTVWQSRPDQPFTNDDGDLVKYLFPKGAQIPFNRLRDGETYDRLILAEGTKQSYAVLSHAPAEYAVYGMSGCWGWKNADLNVVYGRDVFLLLDADYASNPDVYAAADQLRTHLTTHGAKSVRFVTTTGTGKDGVDDALARFGGDGKRAEMLRLWLSQASTKLGKRPRGKKPQTGTDGPEKFFRVRDKPIVLQPADVCDSILEESPAAITAEGNVALYRDGAYRVDANAMLAHVVKMFGNYFTPSIENHVTRYMTGHLHSLGAVLPERATAPLLNCRNTMVDLRTGAKVPHSPELMSSVQVTVDYEPDAKTPVYDAWIRQALAQPGRSEEAVERLVDGLEEAAGTMLDPTRTPSKALFLFGPSRSGKSTFLRLLKAVAGARNTSAVTLHDLVSDQFAAANLYGRMLNVAADLSNKHVEDLSLFKMLTGEDVIKGNRKYGNQFEFTNQALIAFSANELPTVSEASRAYVERMWPVNFPNSFAGHEDKTLEERLMAELPGILSRWVRAYGRFLKRGGYAGQDVVTRQDFEAKSDRVVQFFQDMCTVTPASFGQALPDGSATQRRDVSRAFNEWAKRNGGSEMGERAFFQRLSAVPEVTEVRVGKGRSRAFNLVVASASEDVWDEQDDEPQADPIASSGVALDAGDPWTGQDEPADAAEAAESIPLDLASTDAVSVPEAGSEGFALAASAMPADPFLDEPLGYDF